ncbi:insulin-like growth factor-binding complex acid labile subunit [Octopus vulgaris]|uniref:Insulin-like growth factor-binding complex acid labile subunit n=1 Tax=Octopus vulgaris TaxID=6645 RepID=A0AA36BZQ7_OCTVU|nr:insulin-like growth factor-binding complex acid labile subunit [Octopus vulgaris]
MRFLLESHAVPDVCSICTCTPGGQEVDCRFLNLTSVPQNIGQNVSALVLSNNAIVKIENGSFANLPRLWRLDLSNNAIVKIENGWLPNLPNLEELYLSNNAIEKIENGWLPNLPNLRELDLSNNAIEKIENGSFANLPNLEYIDLSHNAIGKIENGSFANLPNLRGFRMPQKLKVQIVAFIVSTAVHAFL